MFDAVVVVSFGGPETSEDVMPFLRQVTRGRAVSEDRLASVAEHYYARGGSPINEQNRLLVQKLKSALANEGVNLPVYWGNRNWHPFIADTAAKMSSDGVKRALAFVTSAFGSYSGCRQYREDIASACSGVKPPLEIQKLRLFYNHPGFIQPMAEGVRNALGELTDGRTATGDARTLRLLFSAHSIPASMAATSPYEAQLREASALIAERVGRSLAGAGETPSWDLVFQSRSGSPRIPWLEPDVNDHLRSLAARGVNKVVLVPLGFVSDHMEVIQDLDCEAAECAAELGMRLIRSPTVGVHPAFVNMITELIKERLGTAERRWLGDSGPWPDVCGDACCAYSPPGRRSPPARPDPHA